jgi:hypothetical protein
MLRIIGRRTACAAAVVLALVGGALAQSATAIEETPEQLPDFKGRDEAFGFCAGCHSFRVVGRQGMDRDRWDATLSFMTEKHNMPAPDPDTRKLLLDYLSQAYPASSPAKGGWVSPFAPTR